MRGQPGGHVLGPPRARNTAPQVSAGAALQESNPWWTGRRAAQQAVDDFMGGAVATDRDYQPLASRGGVVGGIPPSPGLDDLEVQIVAGFRTATPEAAGSAAGRRRDDDYEGLGVRRAVSPSPAICC